MKWWLLVVLTAGPGLLFVASGLSYRLERNRLERQERAVDVYPLREGRVRVTPKAGGSFFHAVVADPARPERDLPWAEAVKFSWRRDDSGPCERLEAGVLEVRHHGRPLDLLYSAPLEVAAVLRVYPSGRPSISPRLREAEHVQWILAGLWLGPWAAVLAWRARKR